MTSAELTGWLAYLQVDDEVKAQRAAYSIVKAFNGEKGQKQKQKPVEDEEVIDTTDPSFAKNFQGFTYAKPAPVARRQSSTEILIG